MMFFRFHFSTLTNALRVTKPIELIFHKGIHYIFLSIIRNFCKIFMKPFCAASFAVAFIEMNIIYSNHN